MTDKITFRATVYKVQTMPDWGLRLTLDFAESDIMQAAMLMECKRMGVVLDIEALPVVQDASQPSAANGKKGRPERKSLRGE